MYPATVLNILHEQTENQVRALWRIPILEVANALNLPLIRDGNEYCAKRSIFGRAYTAHINLITNDWYCSADEEFPHSFIGVQTTIDLVLFSSEGFEHESAIKFLVEKFPTYRIPVDAD